MNTTSKYCARQECNKVFVPKDYRTRFCGHSCAAKVTNPNRNPNRLTECLNCQKSLGKGQPKFCSRQCSGQYKKNQKIIGWLEGRRDGSDINGNLLSWVKEFLLDEAGHKCTSCGWAKINPVSNKVPLTIDHVDGNWLNNKRENLKVLCWNCHSLTPTFGGLNAGNVEISRDAVKKMKSNGQTFQVVALWDEKHQLGW